MPTRSNSKQTPQAVDEATPFERALAYAALTFVIVGLLGFAITMTHLWLRATVPFFDSVVFQQFFFVPAISIPLAFVCILTLIFVSMRRRAKEQRSA
ncbi:hypothetical protein [Humidisolicoccus flavus]|uniref:hypothetical protein n=1 Tax=Humidisolicoccus flavus TaxID=3111414 RepID=UPI00324C0D0E